MKEYLVAGEASLFYSISMSSERRNSPKGSATTGLSGGPPGPTAPFRGLPHTTTLRVVVADWKRLLTISTVALLYCVAAGTGRAGPSEDGALEAGEFIAVGEFEIQDDNAAEAREKAIEDALVLVFRQGLSYIIAVDQAAPEMAMTTDEIEETLSTRMMIYIDKYQIISETQDESLYRVEVKGWVNLERLYESLVGMGVVAEQEHAVTRLALSICSIDRYELYRAALDWLREVPGVRSITLHKMRAGTVWLFVDYQGDEGELAMAVHKARILERWAYASLIGPGEIEMLLLPNDRRPW